MTWVHDRIYAAGGAHIPGSWAEFSETTGINAILHLGIDRPQVFCGPTPAAFLWIQVEREQEADLATRLLAARFIDDSLREGRRVLLHGAAGRHRTRWAFIAYSVLAGKSLRVALRSGAERPWLAPYHTDQDVWEEYVKLVEGDRLENE